MTQKEIIKNYLTDNWIPSWQLIKVNTKWGWLGISADRRARLLAENGEIERKQMGKYAHYRRKQKYITELYGMIKKQNAIPIIKKLF